MFNEYAYIRLHFELVERIRDEKNAELKKHLCLQDLSIYEEFIHEWKLSADEQAQRSMKMGHLIGETFPLDYYKQKYAHLYNLPRYSSFKDLAIIYEKEGNYEAAADICKDAIRAGQENDGTKGGMAGRLKKLEAKLAQLKDE